MSVITMKTNTIVELIAQISSLPLLDEAVPIASLQSISSKQGCNQCSFLSEVSEELKNKVINISQRYNKLLRQSQTLIDLNYELFEEQHKKFEETIFQLQKDNQQNQERIKELQNVVDQSTKTINQYRNLVFEKEENIAQLQDRLEKQLTQKTMGSPFRQIEILKNHKRQRSQLYNKLEVANGALFSQNIKIKQENKQLNLRLIELQQYVRRMEDDLAHINVKSPRIINKFDDLAIFSANQINRQSRQTDQKSVDDHSSVSTQRNALFQPQYEAQQFQNSFSSSFAPDGRPLRDILNISSHTSNYFNFRTRQRFQQSNTGMITYSNQNIENDPNSINMMRATGREEDKKIMEIKEFEVNEHTNENWQQKILHKNPSKKDEIILKKEDYPKKTVPSIQIDPYYAFFCLTIQCLKLNWRSLEEVANIGLNDEWDVLLERQVPMNKWSEHLQRVMTSRLKL